MATTAPNPLDLFLDLIADRVVEKLKGAATPPTRMRLKQAASIAGVSTCTLRDEIEMGRLPASKQGRYFLVDMADLTKWMEGSKIKP